MMLGGGHNICCGNRGAWCLILLAIAIVVPHQGSNAQSVAPDLVLCVGACNNPTDVAIDPVAGYLYIVDQAYNRVLRYPPVGTLTASSQPEAVFGQADFLGVMANRGGLPSGDTLSEPYGAFVDSAGTLWIADTVNNRVLWFLGAALRSNGTSADGVLGQPNFTSNNPSLGPAGMRKPTSVQVDQNDTLWVSDSANNRVLRFPGASALTNGSSAFSVLGQPDMQSNSSGVSPASLNGPSRVAVASDGHLFLCDNHNQRVWAIDGGNASLTFMQPDLISNSVPSPPTASSGNYPWTASFDERFGDLYVADLVNNRVVVYQGGLSPTANNMAATAVLGQPDFTSAGFGAAPDQMSSPISTFFHPSTRTLWVADYGNHRVLQFSRFLLQSQDSSSLGMLVAFQGRSPAVRLLPKDGQGNTFPGLFQLFLRPKSLDEEDAANNTVVSVSFPLSEYNITTYVDAENTQHFEFGLSLPDVQVGLDYALFEVGQTLNSSGIKFTTRGSSLKLSVVIGRWNFSSASHSLALSLSLDAIPPFTSISVDEANSSNPNVTTFVLESAGGLQVVIDLLRVAEVDGVVAPVAFSFSANLSILVMRFPSFSRSLSYDPDFSVAIVGTATTTGDGGGSADLSLVALASLVVIPLFLVTLVCVIGGALWLYRRRKINHQHSVNYMPGAEDKESL